MIGSAMIAKTVQFAKMSVRIQVILPNAFKERKNNCFYVMYVTVDFTPIA